MGSESGAVQRDARVVTAAVPEIVTASPGVAVVTDTAGLRAEVAQLREAMDSRAVIEQARGILMALASCSSPAAWDLLVEISQHSNVKLRVVSAGLVATTSGERLPSEIEPAFRQALGRSRDSRGR